MASSMAWSVGSSPRGRGTPAPLREGTPCRRFIPAWAGNTGAPRHREVFPAVHPRVGGEHTRAGIIIRSLGGSSPRGRGTRHLASKAYRPFRFIPAWAGNTWSTIAPRIARPVHPRVGGEHRTFCRRCWLSGGSSPRGRGTRQRCEPEHHGVRFIPAWAGNTRAFRAPCR